MAAGGPGCYLSAIQPIEQLPDEPIFWHPEEAVADIVEAITCLNERNPTAAAKLDAEIARCIDRLADREFEGPVSRLRSGAVVRSFRIY
jgi:plasmid stabilization system protein ParE